MPRKPEAEQLFGELIRIMRKLRGPEGCPWDHKQGHESLLPHLFSEAEEVKEAIRKKDWENLEEELGDILLQVVFHSQVAAENKRFTIAGVVRGLNEKLIRRHPHVFGGTKLTSADDVYRQWDEIKRGEKKARAAARRRRSPRT